MIEFVLNDQKVKTTKPGGYLLLDFIRIDRRLKGTKIGCREGDCGACNVLIGELINGQVKYLQATSCLTPLGNVQGKHVVTIEGLNMKDLSPVQEYMVEEAGTQCGFCTPGFIVSLTGYCLSHSKPTYQEAIAAIDGNICRCTGYKSIERAASQIVYEISQKNSHQTISWLVEKKFIPSYFLEIPGILEQINLIRTQRSHSVLVGGGTDLYVQKPHQLQDLEVVTLDSYADLRTIKVENEQCILGGGTRIVDMMESKVIQQLFPSIFDYIKLISSTPIRNIATLSGNFVNASPIGDLTILFLALNAKFTLNIKSKHRTKYLKDFYLGYKELEKKPGEMISKISFKIPPENSYFNFEKVSKRIHLDIASVNSAAQIIESNGIIRRIHISAGGVGPIPIYLKDTCNFLQDMEITALNIKAANKILQSEINPISDVRGSSDYKRILIRQLFFAHFIKLFPRHVSLNELT